MILSLRFSELLWHGIPWFPVSPWLWNGLGRELCITPKSLDAQAQNMCVPPRGSPVLPALSKENLVALGNRGEMLELGDEHLEIGLLVEEVRHDVLN